jgi:menaquinone-dependent protoporphyrinogen IX oxidase
MPPPTPRVLVGYITRTGYLRTVASSLAKRLRAHGFEVHLADLELCTRHPERFDAVILGSGVRFGQPGDAMIEYITEHRDALVDRPVGFFVVDHAARATRHLTRFFDRARWRPPHVLALPGITGAKWRRTVEWFRETFLEARGPHVEAPTEWRNVEAFADELATAIRAAGPRADRGPLPILYKKPRTRARPSR